MRDLIYEVFKEGEVAILTLISGNVTMYQTSELQEAFVILLKEGSKKIVLDLSRINFMSSVVLASLVFMLKRTKEAGGNLVLCSIKSSKVEEILDITNLNKVFDIFEDRKKAIDYLTRK
jgi:anti-anti-sigma factor